MGVDLNQKGNIVDEQEDVHGLILSQLSEDICVVPLKGFKMDLSANRNFNKLFFKIGCNCGTAGLLSVEIAVDKTMEDINKALPALVSRIEAQARSFSRMNCEDHKMLRLGKVKNNEKETS